MPIYVPSDKLVMSGGQSVSKVKILDPFCKSSGTDFRLQSGVADGESPSGYVKSLNKRAVHLRKVFVSPVTVGKVGKVEGSESGPKDRKAPVVAEGRRRARRKRGLRSRNILRCPARIEASRIESAEKGERTFSTVTCRFSPSQRVPRRRNLQGGSPFFIVIIITLLVMQIEIGGRR